MGELREVGTGFSAQAARGRGHAYDLRRVRDALANWQRSTPAREEAENRIQHVGRLAAEPHERVVKVAERALTKVSALPADERKRMPEQVRAAMETRSRESLYAMPDRALEAVIGAAEDFLSVIYIARAAFVARSVGRIIDRSTKDGIGTGFLVAPDVLMTNQHVLPDRSGASAFSVQFQYELDLGYRELPGFEFRLQPQRLFLTDRELDFTLVAVAPTSPEGTPISSFGYLPLAGVEGKIYVGRPVNIIQHPGGGRKQIVVRESTLKLLPDQPEMQALAHYTGDTKPGSSGSPVFSDDWEVVALHHSGVPRADGRGWLDHDGNPWVGRERDPEMKQVQWVANEGIRVSRLVRRIGERRPEHPGLEGELLDSVLEVGRKAADHDPFVVEAIARAAAAGAPPQVPPVVAARAAEAAAAAGPEPAAPPPAGAVSVRIPLTITVSLGTPTPGGDQPA